MLSIALVGNPNCGKTTLFNMLTDSQQYVGNRPGVTVDKKSCPLKGDNSVIITDLQGVYSLSPFSPEELAAREFLFNEPPDVIINVLDASNLSRGLYLTTQLLEVGRPLIIALNMLDKLEKSHSVIDCELLSGLLDAPAVPLCAIKDKGSTAELIQAARLAAESGQTHLNIYPHRLNAAIEQAQTLLSGAVSCRLAAIKALEADEGILRSMTASAKAKVKAIAEQLEKENNRDTVEIFSYERYRFVDKVVRICLKQEKSRAAVTAKIDRIVLNRFLAFPIFFAVVFLIYYICVSVAGSAVAEFIDRFELENTVNGQIQAILEHLNCNRWVFGLVLDGIVGALGSVLEFLPQVFMLFAALGALEESGYMARIAFLTDRVFRAAGLSGKAFIPLLVGSGCSVPALMATRTIENDKMRTVSLMVTSFIPCSAKLAVISFIVCDIFNGPRYTLMFAFIFAAAAVFLSGLLIKDSRIFGKVNPPFLMELPSYSVPSMRAIIKNAARQSVSFIKKAGSVILLSSIAVWFLSSFGIINGTILPTDDFSKSLLGSLGAFLAPVFAPLGFGTGEMSVAVIAGLFAKENIVGTLEVLYGRTGLSLLSQQISLSSALSFLAFNLLCPPCIVAVNTMRRELNSTKKTAFALFYQTAFAYLVSFLIAHL